MDKSKLAYKCEKCGQKFRFPCRLKEHQELLHSGKIYNCSKCDREFKRKSTRDLHERSHEEDFEWHECDLCEKKFATGFGLGNHIQAVHNEGLEANHHCVFCERGFISVRDFERHITGHIQEKPNFCKECGREFNCQYAAASHRKTHKAKKDRPRPFKCNRCSKTYINPKGLSLHIKVTHLKLKEFECTICGKEFGFPGGLQEHTKTHTGERPFACSVCSKTFKASEKLKQHLIVHTRERPFPCRCCDKAFCRNSVRKIHERNIHGNDV